MLTMINRYRLVSWFQGKSSNNIMEESDLEVSLVLLKFLSKCSFSSLKSHWVLHLCEVGRKNVLILKDSPGKGRKNNNIVRRKYLYLSFLRHFETSGSPLSDKPRAFLRSTQPEKRFKKPVNIYFVSDLPLRGTQAPGKLYASSVCVCCLHFDWHSGPGYGCI